MKSSLNSVVAPKFQSILHELQKCHNLLLKSTPYYTNSLVLILFQKRGGATQTNRKFHLPRVKSEVVPKTINKVWVQTCSLSFYWSGVKDSIIPPIEVKNFLSLDKMFLNNCFRSMLTQVWITCSKKIRTFSNLNMFTKQ